MEQGETYVIPTAIQLYVIVLFFEPRQDDGLKCTLNYGPPRNHELWLSVCTFQRGLGERRNVRLRRQLSCCKSLSNCITYVYMCGGLSKQSSGFNQRMKTHKFDPILLLTRAFWIELEVPKEHAPCHNCQSFTGSL